MLNPRAAQSLTKGRLAHSLLSLYHITLAAMLLYSVLLRINISLVTNNKINYGSLFMFVVLLVLVIVIGGHIWLAGMELVQSSSYLRKTIGGLLLAVAVLIYPGAGRGGLLGSDAATSLVLVPQKPAVARP
uniref:Uncharacterized protein n=1 Tax=Tanacetum cinerariifolium TaxID=118510 RepID=A0A699SZF3_TANCI|nr:hypothetical protein [Tanacetum cinerariifolium]